ncbi:MAG: Spy/CpxP family protein refolding chaperone [Desulfobaccales bacterium]
MKPLGKKSLLLILTLVLAVGLVAVVWAEAPKGAPKGAPKEAAEGMMWHGHHGHMNLTPEQAAKLFDVKEKFLTDTAALRKQLFVGRAEMAALWKAENPDEKAIVAKVKELSDLRGQMMEKRVLLHLEIRKIAPQGFKCMRRGEGVGMGPGLAMAMGPEFAMVMDPGFPMDMDPGFPMDMGPALEMALGSGGLAEPGPPAAEE